MRGTLLCAYALGFVQQIKWLVRMDGVPEMSLGLSWKVTLKIIFAAHLGKPMQADLFVNVGLGYLAGTTVFRFCKERKRESSKILLLCAQPARVTVLRTCYLFLHQLYTDITFRVGGE